MKKFLLGIGFLIFAILMLPGIFHAPVASTRAPTTARTRVMELARGIETALKKFQADTGRFPEGGAGEIIEALRGKNENAKAYIDPAPGALNDHGEMLDPWGTPFRITFDTASRKTRIHSAGPNLIFDDTLSPAADDYYSWVGKNSVPALPFLQ